MPALEEVLVGCRADSRWYQAGLAITYAGRCESCHCQVFVKPSAFDLLRSDEHDAKVVCEYCEQRFGASEKLMGL